MSYIEKTVVKTSDKLVNSSFDARDLIVGIEAKVPLLDGQLKTYINFDNAASTPALREVLQTVNDFMPWYSSVHRGSGFKSLLATKAYDDAREIVSDFFGANSSEHVVIFGKNSTEAINKLAYRLDLAKGDVVLVSLLEHHSNDLPWRGRAQVKHIKTDKVGRLDEANLDNLLKTYGHKVKLVAITGASNVTGHMPNIHRIAKKVHDAGAQILVDCAQLAPHRRIAVKSLHDPEHLDYIAVSAHKMYAPFGTGALIGRKDTFEKGEPDQRGGGTIDVVTTTEVDWAAPPDSDEAGSPNVVGAVAMATALKALDRIGMDKIAKHETELTTYTLEKMSNVARLEILGENGSGLSSSRLGVIPFNIKGLHHSLVAAILGTEWGIGVRSGCFCAHPYVTDLLDLPADELRAFRDDVRKGDKSTMPGLVRVSFGMYNSQEEVDELIEALAQIAAGDYKGTYKQDKRTGDYCAVGWEPTFPVKLLD
jgi:selenocysteine lyase/cysteine desulfurase